MKKKILGIIIIIVLVLGIGAGVVYKIIEKDVTDRETFDYKTDPNGSNDTVSHDEHSLYGKIIESYQSYIVIEPNEGEDVFQKTHKILIGLDESSIIYEIGANVKITYDGRIKMSNPAQIDATKIEILSET